MKIWNGSYQITDNNKCKAYLYPSTCAMISLMVGHSKEVAKSSDEPISIIVIECPCRDIK